MRPHVSIRPEPLTDTVHISVSSAGHHSGFIVSEQIYEALEAQVVARWKKRRCPGCGRPHRDGPIEGVFEAQQRVNR